MVSVERAKSDRCLGQRQRMGGSGVQDWMSGVA